MKYVKALTLATGMMAMAAIPASAFQDEGTVRLGSTEPLTGVGAVYGQPTIIGKQIAIREINAAGGIMIDGKKVKLDLISEDDQARPDQGVSIFRKLEGSDKVLAITGTIYSRVSETMWGLLQKKLDDPNDTGLQVPSMSFLSMKAGVASISPWAFRNAGVECDQHEQLFKLVQEANNGAEFTNVVAALESNEAHSAAAWRVCYQGSLKKRNWPTKEYVEWFEQDTDFSVQVRRIRRAKPDLFILSSHYQANVGAMLEMARQGVKPKFMISHIGADAVEMIDLGGKAVEGVVFPSTAFFSDPGVKSLLEEYSKKTGEWYMPAFTYLAYEGMYLMKHVMETSGIKNTPESLADDRRKIRDALANLKDWPNPMGLKLTMGPTGDISRPYVYVTIKDGTFKLWWHPEKGYMNP